MVPLPVRQKCDDMSIHLDGRGRTELVKQYRVLHALHASSSFIAYSAGALLCPLCAASHHE